jgi:ribosomal protein S12 methylthiotransferase accessory factor
MLLNIDFSSEAGRALLARIEAQHGATFARLAQLTSRTFAMQSPWAPGLAFVGAEARGANGQTFSLGGTGLALDDAVVSCLGEGVERLSQVECDGDVAQRLTIAAASDRLTAGTLRLLELRGVGPEGESDWVEAADIATGRTILLPADWCLRRAAAGPLALPDTPLSTGAAAGPTAEAAAVAAILELVERDAAALWWEGGRRARPFASDDPALATGTALLTQLRQDRTERISWHLDLTTDLGIPCVAAVSVAPAGDQLACGLAARLSAAEAMRAATFELCQMELGFQLIALKRQQRGDAALSQAERLQLARATAIDAETCLLLQPSGRPRRSSTAAQEDHGAALAVLQMALAAASIEVALVDLTRPQYGIPVMVAVAPDLQRLPSAVPVARLTDTIAATGGAKRWTRGIPIL